MGIFDFLKREKSNTENPQSALVPNSTTNIQSTDKLSAHVAQLGVGHFKAIYKFLMGKVRANFEVENSLNNCASFGCEEDDLQIDMLWNYDTEINRSEYKEHKKHWIEIEYENDKYIFVTFKFNINDGKIIHIEKDKNKVVFEYLIDKNEAIFYDYNESKKNKFIALKQSIISSLDKDGNGEIDVIDNSDFDVLLNKHQQAIISIDRKYVQQFVKIALFLKTKKSNIKKVFTLLQNIKEESSLRNYVGVIKNELHSYNLLLANALAMVTALVNDDMISFYHFYEPFDRLSIFNSNWENDVSKKLNSIDNKLDDLIMRIEEMTNNIINEIGDLKNISEEFQQSINERLTEIGSSINFNNLITGVQTYQLYKISKSMKKLGGSK